MIPIVALYESWVPFVVAVWVALIHHGVMGSLSPESVFNHAAQEHPWTWAGVHSLAILAACLGAVVNWRAQDQFARPRQTWPSRACTERATTR